MKKIVIALGGNAIKQWDQKGTAEEQFENVKISCAHIVQIIQRGYQVVITHGNGPQVGNLLIQQEEGAHAVPAQPLSICGAMSQGQIGCTIQQALLNELKDHGKHRLPIEPHGAEDPIAEDGQPRDVAPESSRNPNTKKNVSTTGSTIAIA